MIDLSIVVPAYNEADRLPASLALIRRYLSARGFAAEVIVVDDGSRDATAEHARAIAADWSALRVITLGRNRGKGAAVRAGIAASRGRSVAFADADLSAPIEQLDELLDELTVADVAIVSRAVPGARLLRRQSRPREYMGRLYSHVARAALLRGVPDAHCGLKAYRGDVARSVFSRVREDGILFDIEALLLATIDARTIAQRPAVWTHHPASRIRLDPRRALGIGAALLRIKLRYPSLRTRKVRPPQARVVATTTMSPSQTGIRTGGTGTPTTHRAP